MLRFLKLADERQCKIEIDYYVPFTIEVGNQEQGNENTLYWRTGNQDNSLLEIGMGEKTGILRRIVLVAVTRVQRGNIKYDSTHFLTGTPIFDISEFNANLNDEKSEFEVVFDETQILVKLDSTNDAKTLINMGRVEIGIGSANEVKFIRIFGLKKEEYAELRDSFKL